MANLRGGFSIGEAPDEDPSQQPDSVPGVGPSPDPTDRTDTTPGGDPTVINPGGNTDRPGQVFHPTAPTIGGSGPSGKDNANPGSAGVPDNGEHDNSTRSRPSSPAPAAAAAPTTFTPMGSTDDPSMTQSDVASPYFAGTSALRQPMVAGASGGQLGGGLGVPDSGQHGADPISDLLMRLKMGGGM